MLARSCDLCTYTIQEYHHSHSCQLRNTCEMAAHAFMQIQPSNLSPLKDVSLHGWKDGWIHTPVVSCVCVCVCVCVCDSSALYTPVPVRCHMWFWQRVPWLACEYSLANKDVSVCILGLVDLKLGPTLC